MQRDSTIHFWTRLSASQQANFVAIQASNHRRSVVNGGGVHYLDGDHKGRNLDAEFSDWNAANDSDSDAVHIKMDNRGAIALVRNPQFQATGGIKLAYLPTDQMIADGLTKRSCPSNSDDSVDLIGLHTDGYGREEGTATKQ